MAISSKVRWRAGSTSNRSNIRYSVSLNKNCPIRPEKHGTDRPLRNRLLSARVAFVEAARHLGGHEHCRTKAKLTHRRIYYLLASLIKKGKNEGHAVGGCFQGAGYDD